MPKKNVIITTYKVFFMAEKVDSMVSELLASAKFLGEDVSKISEASSEEEMSAKADNMLKYLDNVAELKAQLGDNLDEDTAKVFDLLSQLGAAVKKLNKKEAA